jgi:hypothetical protein
MIRYLRLRYRINAGAIPEQHPCWSQVRHAPERGGPFGRRHLLLAPRPDRKQPNPLLSSASRFLA